MKNYFSIALLFTCFMQAQTYVPQVGFEGSTAIYKDNSIFIDWANSIEIIRGYKNIAIPENGHVAYGIDTNALDKANANVVSLGDGGVAILHFNHPIVDGDGADFAIFENGFLEEEGSELAFLELAFVEVSTDGIEYIRFPSISENQTENQIDGFGFINARYIHNFAGKYIQNYGTPFDLSELIPLAENTSVNLNEINYIKITDVGGVIANSFTTYDSQNNAINDPYPTEFNAGGFDLDAIGVINNTENQTNNLVIFPNPTKSDLHIKTGLKIQKIQIYSLQGKHLIVTNSNQVNVSFLSSGIYFILVETSKKVIKAKFIKN